MKNFFPSAVLFCAATAFSAAPTISYSPSTVVDTVGKAAAHTPTTSGSITSCSVTSGTLPAGLSINNTTCVISGTPTTAKVSTAYTITASNSTGSAIASLNLTVLLAKPTVSFSPSTLVDTIGKAATHTPTITGTITNCSISVGILPLGLSINTTTCAITGTPLATLIPTGFTITATNSTGSGSAALNLSVLIAKPTVSFSPSTVVDTLGKAVTHTPTTTGTLVNCAIAPALPLGLSINILTCAISGTPTTTQTSTAYTITATNLTGSGTATLNLSVLIAKPTVSFSPSTVVDTVSKSATHSAATTGTITTCTVSPTLPSGLNINSSTCAISGTPTASHSATTYTVTASNSTGSGTGTLNLTILIAKPTVVFSPSTVIDTMGVVTSNSPVTTGTISSCGITPGLSQGLSISNSTCIISGTPTKTRTSTVYTITATNSTGSATVTLNLTVQQPTAPVVNFNPGTLVDTIGKTATHTPTTTGTITTCVASPTLPVPLAISNSTCVISGTPAATQASTAYTITATNSTGSGTATVNLSILIAKPTVAFSPSTVADTIGQAVTHTPTTTGTLSSCSISPTLPPGLNIDGLTCVISGSPTTAQASTVYTITATNSTGSNTATLNLSALISKPTLSFSPGSVVDTVDVAAMHVPATTGTISSCTASPSLPVSLSINNSTCVISGTPTAPQALTAYTITAANSTGSATAIVNLSVQSIPTPIVTFNPGTLVDTMGKAVAHTPTTTGIIKNCTATPSLPSPMVINTATCVISGTPAATQSSTAYTITASNSMGSGTATVNLSILIAKPTVAFSPATVSDTIGAAAVHTPTTTGTITSCTITPALSSGLSINNSTCAISGTPTTARASTAYTITAANSTGSGTATLNLSVLIPKPTLSFSPGTATDSVDIAATHSPATTGTITSCSASPALPASLSLNNSTCVISGTPTAPQSLTAYVITAANSTGSVTAALNLTVLTIATPVVTFNPGTLVDTVGKMATHTPTISGIITSCTANPSLPSPLVINNTTCVIFGTPTATQAPTTYTITATNSMGSGTAALNLGILIAKPTLAFSPNTVADTIGVAATHIPTTTGTITNCTISPTLPSGYSLNATQCSVSGNPSIAQTSTAYIITASNSTGSATATLNLSVLIPKPALSFSPNSVLDSIDIAVIHAPTTTGLITNCIASPSLPSGLSVNNTTCIISGSPTSAQLSTAYAITASNSTGSATAILNLGVMSTGAPLVAFNPGAWVDTVGKTVTHVPSTLGTITSCTTNPVLPSSLSIDNNTCVITGTPTAAQASTAYAVTASNSTGSGTATLNLSVLIAKPTVSFSPGMSADTIGTMASHSPTTTGVITHCGVSPALPSGYSFDTATCVIAGTPTTSQESTTYAITATNSTGSATATLNLSVLIPKPMLNFFPASVFDTMDIPAVHVPTITGIITSCTASPSLPPSLSIDNSTCIVSGAPTAAQPSTTYVITASNSTGFATAILNLAVMSTPVPVVAFNPGTLMDTVGKTVTHTPTTSGTITSCTANPPLPPSLSINGNSCMISGTPATAQASIAYTITAANSAGSGTATLNLGVLLAKPTLSFSPGTVSDTVGVAATHTATITGTIGDCVVSPSLPSGFSMDNNTCEMTGIPSAAQTSTSYAIMASNSTGSATATLNLSVLLAKPTLSFSPGVMVDTIDQAISHTPVTTGSIASCTVTPILPSGYNINHSTCEITGTPVIEQSLTGYTITASNSTGSGVATLSLGVHSIPTPVVTFASGGWTDTVGVSVIHAPLVSGSITSCAASPALPAGLVLGNTTCAISGIPAAPSPSTLYAITASNGSGSGTTTLNLNILLAKPTVTFSPNSLLDTAGKPATHMPLITSLISGCVISPSLPTGFVISSTTCAISGTPTVAPSSKTYKVTATNSTGSDTATFNLSVLIAKPTVSFSPNSVVDTAGKAATHIPSTTGVITSCTISPTLPVLFSFNDTTCAISGTPIVTSPTTVYTVTASNSTGSGSTTLNLSVLSTSTIPLVTFGSGSVMDTMGIFATHTPTLSGGTPTICTASPALPEGISIGNATCIITGVPTAPSSSTVYTITALNGNGSGTTTLNLAVLIAKPTVSFSPNLVNDTVGQPTNHIPTTSSSIANCTISPALPAGYVIDNTTCAISGTPTTDQAAKTYTIMASNSTGTGTATLNISVRVSKPTVSFSPNSFVDTIGKAVVHTATTTSSITSCLSSPALPTGLVLNNTTCAISGTPIITSPTTTYAITAANGTGSGTATLSLSILSTGATPLMTYGSTPLVDTIGTSLLHAPTLSGGAPNTCTASPALPAGLVLSNTTCIITGTPLAVSLSTPYTITATNSSGSGTAALNLAVLIAKPSISFSPNLVNDTVGLLVNHTPIITGPIASCAISPALPLGYVIDSSTCVISGTPTLVTSATTYTITASNSTGIGMTTLKVASIAPIITYPVTTASYLVGAMISDNTPLSVGGPNTQFSISPNLTANTGLIFDTLTGMISGTPTVQSLSKNYTVAISGEWGTTAITLKIASFKIPSSLSYSDDPTTYVLGIPITPNSPSVSGMITHYSVNPPLPQGLILDSLSGVISGIPTGAQHFSADYVVTASNPMGSVSGTVNIGIVGPPSNLSYQDDAPTYGVGMPIFPFNPPAVRGIVTYYSVSPAFPLGIILDASTGYIMGTPLKVSPAAEYTITAQNPGGYTQTTITLGVTPVPNP